MYKTSYSRSRNAFTLIELIIVIAIISILAGILFPVFAQAREKAKLATCQSNLRQIGLAFAQYTQDFDEDYPCDTSDKYLWQGQHFRWLIMPYLGFSQQKVSSGSFVATSNYAEILTCPSDPSKSFNSTSYFYSADFYIDAKQLPSVISCFDLFGPPFGAFPATVLPVPRSLGQVSSPTSKILAGEWADNHDKIYSPSKGFLPQPTLDTSRAYVFADGHVKYLADSKINLGYDGIPDPNTTIGGISGSDVGQ